MEKVAFIDIDGVITHGYNIDIDAMKVIAKMVKSGVRVAFITGNPGYMLERQIVPYLRAYNLVDKVLLYAEMGHIDISHIRTLLQNQNFCLMKSLLILFKKTNRKLPKQLLP